MKKLALAATIAAAFAAPSAAHAQGLINVNAHIADYIQFGPNGKMDFGSLASTGANAVATGYVSLDHNVKVDITFPDGAATGLLTHGTSAAATIQPAYKCGHSGTTTAPATYQIADCLAVAGTAFQLDRTTTPVTTNYIHFEGTISTTQLRTALPGTYSGKININAARSTS